MTDPNIKDPTPAARRALLVGEGEDVSAFESRLAAAGYETRRAGAADAPADAAGFAPDVVLVASGDGEEAHAEAVALVRRLRQQPSTYALPSVLLFRQDARSLRAAALGLGADDYFSIDAPAEEVRARLDSLSWRVEAGRRNAPTASDQRAEIDNFLLLLEGVRADSAEGGARGAVALLSSTSGGAEPAAAVAEAYGFFKLNLRRADAVALYGPTMLLAYLPGRTRAEARAVLDPLREEFLRTRGVAAGLALGVASFPEDGDAVEDLVERAEARLEEARSGRQAADVQREGDMKREPAPPPAPKPHAPSARESRMLDAIDSATASLTRADPRAESGEKGAARRDAQQAGKQTQAHRPAPARGVTRRLLLVVSDAARMAQLNLLIRSAAAYDVRAAFDGQQALSLLRIERPDLIVVDQELRDMSGTEMLTQLRRQQGGRLAAHALVLLRDGDARAAREADEIGARTVAAVPYNPGELLNAIRAAAGAA